MHIHHSLTHGRGTRRFAIATSGILALVGAAAIVPASSNAATGPATARHTVLISGLDNPRELEVLPDGDLLVAQAGYGGHNPDNCFGKGQNKQCVGISGKLTVVHDGVGSDVMRGLLSVAGADGTFATGPDGGTMGADGTYYAIIAGGDASQAPPGVPAQQLGHLMAKAPNGVAHRVANVSAYERAHNPDGEQIDSNPYSVLALSDKVLITDAAADDVLAWQNGRLSTWAVLPDGPNYDPVPTTIVEAPGGNILVGELHSEIPHAARVWLYSPSGHVLTHWSGFTTVTGVARAADGTLYVSELLGGVCTPDQIPSCFPGRVVRVSPDGTRTHVNVPLPAGIVVHDGHVDVNAFSVTPGSGFGGNPEWSGQVWEIQF